MTNGNIWIKIKILDTKFSRRENMRTSRTIFLFSVLNLIAGIVFIFQLPENVIFGFISNFYATELINRWYNLIIPIIQVICMLIIYLVDIYKPDVPHKYRYLTSWVALSFTTFIMWCLMFFQYENLELGRITHWPMTVIILFPIALFMLAHGYSSISKNMSEFSFFGFKGVKNNEFAWKKVHNFAGSMGILVGVAMLVMAVLNELVWDTYWIYLVAFGVWFVFYFLLSTVYALSFKDN